MQPGTTGLVVVQLVTVPIRFFFRIDPATEDTGACPPADIAPILQMGHELPLDFGSAKA